MLLGAGTVINVEQCVESIEAGAEFVVSPSLRFDVIEKTKELGKVSIPGALTPTEVISAWEAGGDFVKVFPCSAVGGANYIRALKATLRFRHGEILDCSIGFLRDTDFAGWTANFPHVFSKVPD
jgi:2-keto-3-deoxy-6-phosphogluconate aldolase